MNIRTLIGKRIIDIRGFTTDRRITKRLKPRFILFDDGETILKLEDQDYYSFHDCSSSAKELSLCKNKRYFTQILSDERRYPAVDSDLS